MGSLGDLCTETAGRTIFGPGAGRYLLTEVVGFDVHSGSEPWLMLMFRVAALAPDY
jgi:hypothetical protein